MGLRFRVHGQGFRVVWGLRFRVHGQGFRVHGQGLRFRSDAVSIIE